jgi:hypothetical protein
MTTELITLSPTKYLVFSSDTPEDKARAVFVSRYGLEPQQVGRLFPGREIWVGPEPEREDGQG